MCFQQRMPHRRCRPPHGPGVPAAEATVANSRQSSAQKTSSLPRFRIFIINYSPFHSSTNTTDRTSCSVTGCETADTTAS